MLQAEQVSPSRAPAQDGHRPPPGDHRAWLGSDGGWGQAPWEEAEQDLRCVLRKSPHLTIHPF